MSMMHERYCSDVAEVNVFCGYGLFCFVHVTVMGADKALISKHCIKGVELIKIV